MRMTLEEFQVRYPGRTLIPADYAGQWIAWNEDRSEIMAHGTDFTDVYQQAVNSGCERPVMHKIARAPFVGLA